MCPKLRSSLSRFRQPLVAAMVKSSRLPAPNKVKKSTAVAARGLGAKTWANVVEFLSRCGKQRGQDGASTKELIHIISCDRVNNEIQAEVNWYTGGNHYVTLTAFAVKSPGVYFAQARHVPWTDLSEEDQGPQTPCATISHLRWLGTRRQFLNAAHKKKKDIGKKTLTSLIDMLTHSVDSSDAATCGSSNDSTN